MTTEIENVGNVLRITIHGHVTGVSEVIVLKEIMDNNTESSNIELIINDAYVIPSMLIGALLKKVHADKKKVSIQTSQKRLKTLISELSLNTFIEMR